MKGIFPLLGGVMLYAAMGYSLQADWKFSSNVSYTSWSIPFAPHWIIGGVFLVFFVSAVLGVVLMLVWRFFGRDFFAGRTLNRSTPTLVPDVDSAPTAPADPDGKIDQRRRFLTLAEIACHHHGDRNGARAREPVRGVAVGGASSGGKRELCHSPSTGRAL